MKDPKVYIFFALALSMGWGANASEVVDANPPLLSVEGESYTLNDFRNFLQKDSTLQGKAVTKEGIRDVLLEFADSKVFRLEGLRTNFSVDKDVDTSSLTYYFLVQSSLVGQCPVPSDEEVKQFFRSNLDFFASPPLVRVNRIILPLGATVDGQMAQPFLEKMVKDVKSGKVEFKRYEKQIGAALPEEAAKQGDLGFQIIWPSTARPGSFESLAMSAKKGDVLGPFAQDGFVSAFQVTDLREPVPAKWESIAQTGDVQRKMEQVCKESRLESARETLYKRFNVEFNEEVIQKLTPIGSLN